jgi:acetolactate synthase I/II/III large subunit
MSLMKVSDYITRFLVQNGVRAVFELSGGMITHLLDSIYQDGRIRLLSMHHEQAAAFAADAYGRITGVPGIALATSGPGATNLLTGIGSCYFDSSPAVFITGQVNRNEQKGVRPIRQLGFQETDIVSMSRPVTKASLAVRTTEEVPGVLAHAFALALQGRPGPVLLDVPMDIQREQVDEGQLDSESKEIELISPLANTVWDELSTSLRQAERPLILAGGGIRSSRAVHEFRMLIDALRMPVVHSLMAVDVLPFNHPWRVGMIGTYGNRWANHVLAQADFLLVLGSRLDVRQTGSRTEHFKGDRKIAHVDCEPAEINNRVHGCLPVISGLRSFLKESLIRMGDLPCVREPWLQHVKTLVRQWPDVDELKETEGINPNRFMHLLSPVSARACAFVVDVGQHQMWAAQSLELNEGQRFITSGGMGSMGFALPAAIGVAIANTPQPVVVIAGDGGFQCNLQELQTVVRNQLPLKIVVINNRCHGMVRQFQASYFQSRHPATLWGYSTPDFTRVAAAYGIESRHLSAPEEIGSALAWLWQKPHEPALLEVRISTLTNVCPKVSFGGLITEMEPSWSPPPAD